MARLDFSEIIFIYGQKSPDGENDLVQNKLHPNVDLTRLVLYFCFPSLFCHPFLQDMYSFKKKELKS